MRQGSTGGGDIFTGKIRVNNIVEMFKNILYCNDRKEFRIKKCKHKIINWESMWVILEKGEEFIMVNKEEVKEDTNRN